MFQVIRGIAYVHRHGYFHRDLKPENILMGEGTIVKITDFGLVKRTGDPFPYTEYVSTRWYRAPENALKLSKYGPKTDVFALGCIMAEIITMRPLFPGQTW